MKYEVKFSCGHTETVDLVGKMEDRRNKIKWYEESGVCSTCYAEKKNAEMLKDFDLVEMHYGQYKNKFANCKTKQGSYNPKTKTILVYVPKAEQAPADESQENEAAAIKEAAVEASNKIIVRAESLPGVSKEGAKMMQEKLFALMSRMADKVIIENKSRFSYENLLEAAKKASALQTAGANA